MLERRTTVRCSISSDKSVCESECIGVRAIFHTGGIDVVTANHGTNIKSSLSLKITARSIAWASSLTLPPKGRLAVFACRCFALQVGVYTYGKSVLGSSLLAVEYHRHAHAAAAGSPRY